jgi:hypothetical protein
MYAKKEIAPTNPADLGKPRHLSFKQSELEIVPRICELIGVPAAPMARVSRADLNLPDDFRIHIDIGGEGLNEHLGHISGFPDSINLNVLTHQSNDYGIPVPNLVRIKSWYGKVSFPFADGFADYITMQNAPLTDNNVSEIVRCLRPGGVVELWIDEYFEDNMEQLAQLLHSKVELDVVDEFDGSTGSRKYRIVSALKPSLEQAKPEAKNTEAASLAILSFFRTMNVKRITYPGFEPKPAESSEAFRYNS